jgi:hypothetical protein
MKKILLIPILLLVFGFTWLDRDDAINLRRRSGGGSILPSGGYLSYTENSGNGTSLSTSVPAGTASDYIVILIAAIDYESTTFSFPAGFNEFSGSPASCSADGQSAGIAWKRLTGADSGTYSVTASESSDWILAAYLFESEDTMTDPGATVQTHNTLESSPIVVTASGMTPSGNSHVSLLWISVPDPDDVPASLTHTVPAALTFTKRSDTLYNWVSLCGATHDQSGLGATGDLSGTFTISPYTSGWIAFLVAIPYD